MTDMRDTPETTLASGRNAVLEPGVAKALGFGAAIMALAWFFKKIFRIFTGEEDRPPIRVRNPAGVKFTHQHGWTNDQADWLPNHPKGKRTDYFIVHVMSPNGQPERMKGWRVVFYCKVDNGPEKKIMLMARKEPRITPSNELRRDGTGVILNVKNGVRLAKIEVKDTNGNEESRTFKESDEGYVDICIYPKRSY